MRYVIVFMCLVATGCVQSRADRQEDITHHERLVVNGSVGLPGPNGVVAVPVHLVFDRNATTAATSTEERHTTIDGAAIGREIAATVGPLLQAGAGSSPWGITGGIGGAISGLGIAYLAHKKRQQTKGGK